MVAHFDKNLEQEEDSAFTGESTNMYHRNVNLCGGYSGRRKSVYLKLKLVSKDGPSCHKNICSTMFTAGIYKIVSHFKQLRFTLRKKYIKDI